MIEYYNHLLFKLAYPENEAGLKETQYQLHKFSNEFIQKDQDYRNRFVDSGLPGVEVVGFFTLRLLTECRKFDALNISLEYLDEDGLHPKEMMEFLLPEVEYEAIGASEKDKIDFLFELSGSKDKSELLDWLVGLFNQNTLSDKIKNVWFDKLKAVVSIHSSSLEWSKGYVNFALSEPYFHTDGILKKFDVYSIIRSPLKAPMHCSKLNIAKLLKVAQSTLLMISRETDPITYSNPKQVKYFELDRGFSIALFGLDSDRSLPLEFYIGYMMFKNGFPISYGGAWIFGKRALIGINIFEAFRGGESAYLFCQIMRTYSNFFKIEYFEVEPYQFGLNNQEGIKSGAFWFYYRLGYRPQDEKLQRLADREFQKIIRSKSYRSPEKILQTFTSSYLELRLNPDHVVPVSASDWSRWITQRIKQQFGGNRNLALEYSLSLLKRKLKLGNSFTAEHKGFQKLGILLALAVDWDELNEAQIIHLSRIIKLKSIADLDCALQWNNEAIKWLQI